MHKHFCGWVSVGLLCFFTRDVFAVFSSFLSASLFIVRMLAVSPALPSHDPPGDWFQEHPLSFVFLGLVDSPDTTWKLSLRVILSPVIVNCFALPLGVCVLVFVDPFFVIRLAVPPCPFSLRLLHGRLLFNSFVHVPYRWAPAIVPLPPGRLWTVFPLFFGPFWLPRLRQGFAWILHPPFFWSLPS